MNVSLRLPTVFLMTAASLVGGCDDGIDEPETDRSVTFLERQIARDAPIESSLAIAEVDGVAWVAIGTEIVRIPEPQRAERIAQAQRVHGSLVSDERYVYFATQSERLGVDAHSPSAETSHDEGAIFRVLRDGTGAPEKIFDVGILAGPFALRGGHLYVCESAGLNTSGSLVDVALDDVSRAKRIMLRMNELCEGVVADEAHLYLAMNASYKTLIYDGTDPEVVAFPETIELARVSVSALEREEPWPYDEGPQRFVTTTLKPGIQAMHRTKDGIVLGGWSKMVRVSLDGVETVLPASSPFSHAIPDGTAWLEATAGQQTNMKDDTCHGGRLYRREEDKTTELTQAVCSPGAMAAGEALWLVEWANLYDSGMVNARTRLRVKRIERP